MIAWQAHSTRVAGLAFDPAGGRLVTVPAAPGAEHPGPREGVTVWTVAGGRVWEVPYVGTAPAWSTAAAFAPAGDRLAVAGWSLDDVQGVTVRLWDVAAGRLLAERRVGSGVYDLRPLPDGGLLAVQGTGVWRHPPGLAGDPVKLAGPPGRKLPQASRVAVSPDGTRLASTGKTRALVWDAAFNRPLAARVHNPSPQNGPAAFRPGAPVLAVGHGTVVDLWDYQSGAVVTLTGHKRPVWAVGFGPDGGTAYTAASDGTVRAWDAASGAPLRALDCGTGKLYCAAVSPDGLTLAAGGDDGRVTVLDLD
jgi:WD40 repeat protein